MKYRIISILALAAALAAVSCTGKQAQQETEQRVELVETTALKVSDITRELDFSTTLEGWQTVNIAPSLTRS